MSLVFNRATGNIIPFANTPDYPPNQWLINPVLPDGVPWKYLKAVGDEVVEMTTEEKDAIDNPPETMAARHLREQREGVTLTNGWVLKWRSEDQVEMLKAKAIADLAALAGNASPIVPFFEVNGTPHVATYAVAYQILGDYMSRVLVEQQRQWQEAG
jgi:hypothetical protein